MTVNFFFILKLLKFYFLVLDAKLLINQVHFFFFFRKLIDTKKFNKTFHTYRCDRLMLVSKYMMLVVDINEN